MFSILLLLFTVVPAIEIYLLFSIGAQIGGINTLMVVIITGVVGASLAKSQGMAILANIQNDLNKGALPANQLIHGLLVFGGGLLLLTPGFMTDIMGLSMVFPGTRHILVLYLKTYFEKAIRNGNVQFSSFGSGGGFSYSHHSSSHKGFENLRSGPKEVEPGVFEAEFKEK
ncbi:FxsA family protein [Halobacteriovorax sp. HLS]|uniref:FxsA family protein n=1 Tax=Halobacteriovorax sp. HLS TaxID=2234000 RepID=UPI000FD77CD0|nr:FxsA family protein [Halobacteriovorax sp. HLS]